MLNPAGVHAACSTLWGVSSILQIRGVDESDLEVLRQRAEDEGLSLSAYVRRMLHLAATQPTLHEVLEDIAHQEPVDVSTEEILALIHADRPA